MHTPATAITTFDDELRSFVADMVATMYAADGVGLAANQVGDPRSVFVFDCPDDEHVQHAGVVCNPVLSVPEGKDRKLDDSDEGCLSLPGAFVPCPRSTYAVVEGQGLDGRPVRFEGTGLLARCLQHEADHTAGTVFGDRLANRARKKLFKEADKYAAEFPSGWPVTPSP